MDLKLDNGRVLRGSEVLANVAADGTFVPTKAGKRFRLEIAGFLSAMDTLEPHSPTVQEAVQAPVDEALRELVEEAKQPDVPTKGGGSPEWDKAPPMDPEMGDKTPAFVEWLHRNYPEEFARRYKDRKTHLTHA